MRICLTMTPIHPITPPPPPMLTGDNVDPTATLDVQGDLRSFGAIARRRAAEPTTDNQTIALPPYVTDEEDNHDNDSTFTDDEELGEDEMEMEMFHQLAATHTTETTMHATEDYLLQGQEEDTDQYDGHITDYGE